MLSAVLLSLATVLYAVVPSLNYYAHGWEYPFLLTGLMRLGFAVGVIALIRMLYPALLSRQGWRVTTRVGRQEWKLVGLAMLTTGDVALFSLSYRLVDLSVSTALTAMAPGASVVILALLNRSRLTWHQTAGLAIAACGVLLVMWAGGTALVADRSVVADCSRSSARSGHGDMQRVDGRRSPPW